MTNLEKIRQQPDVDLDAVRSLSRSLFGGAQYRLEVGAAIADGDGFANTAELAGELRLARQSVNKELQVLEASGLVVRSPRSSVDRRVVYTRQDSAYWEWCQEARASALELVERRPRF